MSRGSADVSESKPSSQRTSACTVQILALDNGVAMPVSLPTGSVGLWHALDGEGACVYTAFLGEKGGRVMDLDAHLQRLQRDAVEMGIGCPSSSVLRSLISTACMSRSWRMRLELRQLPLKALHPSSTTFLGLEPPRVPPTAVELGRFEARTVPAARRHLPSVKTSAWIKNRRRWELGGASVEHILVDADGALLEGFTSNIHAVRGGVLFSAEQGVLSGVTRARVLDLCSTLGIQWRSIPYPLARLGPPDELFITSSMRGIWPVGLIDSHMLPGCPGPVTRRLMREWELRRAQWMQSVRTA